MRARLGAVFGGFRSCAQPRSSTMLLSTSASDHALVRCRWTPEMAERIAYRYDVRPSELTDAAQGSERREAVLKSLLGFSNASQKEINRVAVKYAIDSFKRSPNDTGSSEVQVALLTSKIAYLAHHITVHRKDVHSRRSLDAMLHKRRGLLKYLKRTQYERYQQLIQRLSLKDNIPAF